MHNGLKFHEIDERFFSFNQASIKGVTDETVESVIQMEYGADVVRTVADVSKQRMNAAITLANKMNVKLAELLERQRGSYYEFEDNDNSEQSVFKEENTLTTPSSRILRWNGNAVALTIA